MPGKPAARLTDMTTHGSPLFPGPGSPNVLIGFLPAWRTFIDFHACPVVKGVVPDVGGVVMMGSPTVWINFQMACRVMDQVIEIPGGPNPIAMGCPTILIGEAGTVAPATPGVALPAASAAALKEDAAAKPAIAKPGPITPKEADDLITKKYKEFLPADKQKGGLAEKGTKVLDDAAFKVEYQKAFGDDGEYDKTNAFANPKTNTIYLHKDRGNAGTPLHEALHLYASKEYNKLGTNMKEGTTEYFTRKETEGRKIDRSGNYPCHQAAIQELANVVGDKTLQKAYFGGKVDDLKNSVDAKIGPGTFDGFQEAIEKDDFDAAKWALQKPVPKGKP